MVTMLPLQIEDYKTIGVRPMEFRPAVIRRAMAKSARPLASLHLSHPDTTNEQKLASVIATGYRLLDPRRREDSLHRMMLGRIHPQLTDEAVRLAQSKGNYQSSVESDTMEEGVFTVGGLIPKPFRPLHHHGDHYFAEQPSSEWGQSLQSTDLLVDRPIRHLIRVGRRWLAYRPVTVATLAAMVSVSLASWRMTKDFGSAERAVVVSARNEAVMVPLIASPADLENSATSVAENAGRVRPLSSSESTEAATESVVNSSEHHNQSSDPIEPVASSMPPLSTSVEPVAFLAPKPVVNSPFLNDLLVADVEEGLELIDRSPPVGLIADAVMPSVAVKEPDLTPILIPTQDEIAECQQELLQVLDGLPEGDWTARKLATTKWMSEASVGDAKRWVGTKWASVFAIRLGDQAEADRHLLEFTKAFGLDRWATTVEWLTIASDGRADESTQKHLIAALATGFGRALLDGELQSAKLIATLLQQAADTGGNVEMAAWTNDSVDTLDTMIRFKSTAEKFALAAATEVTPGDQFSAGRYWALVRRNWVQALPLLSKGSDAKFASLASNESLMGGSPDVEELIHLANGYIAAAERAKGWMHDSFILHADELLSNVQPVASETDLLAIARVKGQLRKDHPWAFAAASSLVLAKPVATETKPLVEIKNATIRGMVGRIRVGNDDIGVLLTYEPGTPLTGKVITQIGEQAKADLAKATVELVGMISVDNPTAVSLQLPRFVDRSTQLLAIDGRLLTPDPETSPDSPLTYRADLARGSWTVRWITPVDMQNPISLSLLDPLSGAKIELTNPPLSLEEHPAKRPTKLKISVVSG